MKEIDMSNVDNIGDNSDNVLDDKGLCELMPHAAFTLLLEKCHMCRNTMGVFN